MSPNSVAYLRTTHIEYVPRGYSRRRQLSEYCELHGGGALPGFELDQPQRPTLLGALPLLAIPTRATALLGSDPYGSITLQPNQKKDAANKKTPAPVKAVLPTNLFEEKITIKIPKPEKLELE